MIGITQIDYGCVLESVSGGVSVLVMGGIGKGRGRVIEGESNAVCGEGGIIWIDGRGGGRENNSSSGISARAGSRLARTSREWKPAASEVRRENVGESSESVWRKWMSETVLGTLSVGDSRSSTGAGGRALIPGATNR